MLILRLLLGLALKLPPVGPLEVEPLPVLSDPAGDEGPNAGVEGPSRGVAKDPGVGPSSDWLALLVAVLPTPKETPGVLLSDGSRSSGAEGGSAVELLLMVCEGQSATTD